MRALFLAALALGLSAPAMAQKLKDESTNGAHTSLTIADANACAVVCAADGHCLGWIFLDSGVCELKGVEPTQSPLAGADLRDTEPVSVADAHAASSTEQNDGDSLLLGGANDASPGTLRPRLGAGTR